MRSKTPIEMRCQVCRNIFQASRKDQKMCSRVCRLRSHQQRGRLYKDGVRDGKTEAYGAIQKLLSDEHGDDCSCRVCVNVRGVRLWNTRPERDTWLRQG